MDRVKLIELNNTILLYFYNKFFVKSHKCSIKYEDLIGSNIQQNYTYKILKLGSGMCSYIPWLHAY